MKLFVCALIIICAGLLQVTLLDNVSLWGIKPDLLLISAITMTLMFGERQAVALSAFAGMIKDMYGGGAAGGQVILFIMWGVLIYKLARKIALDTLSLRVAVIAIAAFLNNFISGMSVVYRGAHVPIGVFIRILLVGSIYTAIVSSFVAPAILSLCPPKRASRRMQRDMW